MSKTEYYWARHRDGSEFIVKREGGEHYAVGIDGPLMNFSGDTQTIERVRTPEDIRMLESDNEALEKERDDLIHALAETCRTFTRRMDETSELLAKFQPASS